MEITGFSDFIGQKRIKDYFADAAKNDRAGHAYILSGMKGSGKKTLARLFGMALLCGSGEDKPCGTCHSCKMAISGNHPDLITLTHEKPALISIDEIKEQLVSGIQVRPYYKGKKIYIIPDSDMMNIRAQNALLKSIEEPPAYAVIILVTDNPSSLIPTIHSRCSHISTVPLPNETVKDYLIKNAAAGEKEASICAAFAGGSIGNAYDFLRSENFREDLGRTMDLIKRSKNLPSNEIFAFSKEASSDRTGVLQILDTILLVYRDILMYKTMGEQASLTFIDETEYIESKARETDYNEIGRVIRSTEELKGRLRSNVNVQAGLDVLLLNISEPVISQ
ncbi:MAG: DNA polymerase III subunit delta [Lachnospiraceae bacterium]|nr:DNA polymerase III subunit delta [Lachnospiraceae bacterium]